MERTRKEDLWTMIKYCLACGCKMNSKTNGWECPNCNCYQDTNGNFHSSIFENRSLNMTNADKIRSMTDEELVVFLDNFSSLCLECSEDFKNENCPIYKSGRYCKPKHIMEWLKSSSEGE